MVRMTAPLERCPLCGGEMEYAQHSDVWVECRNPECDYGGSYDHVHNAIARVVRAAEEVKIVPELDPGPIQSAASTRCDANTIADLFAAVSALHALREEIGG